MHYVKWKETHSLRYIYREREGSSLYNRRVCKYVELFIYPYFSRKSIIHFTIFKYTVLAFICTIRDSIVASIPACHAGDRGSIPRRGAFLFC